MIERIFFDLDECLLHSVYWEPDQDHLKIVLDNEILYTMVRPCANALIEYARELVGNDKVYILTSSDKEYANEINRLAGFGFERDYILHRDILWDHTVTTAYDGTSTLPHSTAHKDNVLIDNLPMRYNENKIAFAGITSYNYYQVPEYYGVNFPDDPFEEDVKEFLSDRMR